MVLRLTPAARATSASVIDDQSRVRSNSRMPSRIESRSSTRDASAYGTRCAVRPRACPVTRATLTPSGARVNTTSRACDLDHLEIGLGRAAVGAAPVVGNVVPPGARGNAVVRPAQRLVVLEAALHALEQFVVGHCPNTSRPCRLAVRSRLFPGLHNRAAPVVGDLLPRGAGWKAFAGGAFGFVVDVVAHRAPVAGHQAAAVPYRARIFSRPRGLRVPRVMSPP